MSGFFPPSRRHSAVVSASLLHDPCPPYLFYSPPVHPRLVTAGPVYVMRASAEVVPVPISLLHGHWLRPYLSPRYVPCYTLRTTVLRVCSSPSTPSSSVLRDGIPSTLYSPTRLAIHGHSTYFCYVHALRLPRPRLLRPRLPRPRLPALRPLLTLVQVIIRFCSTFDFAPLLRSRPMFHVPRPTHSLTLRHAPRLRSHPVLVSTSALRYYHFLTLRFRYSTSLVPTPRVVPQGGGSVTAPCHVLDYPF